MTYPGAHPTATGSPRMAGIGVWLILGKIGLMIHPRKITFGELRAASVRRVIVFCSDHKCGYSIELDADLWHAGLRLPDIEECVVCQSCGKRGADVRPIYPSAPMGIHQPKRT
jgi:hypothetical protein